MIKPTCAPVFYPVVIRAETLRYGFSFAEVMAAPGEMVPGLWVFYIFLPVIGVFRRLLMLRLFGWLIARTTPIGLRSKR